MRMQVTGIRPLHDRIGSGLPPAMEVTCQGKLLLPLYCEELPRATRLYPAVNEIIQHISSLGAQPEASDASADTHIEGGACMHACRDHRQPAAAQLQPSAYGLTSTVC